MAELSGSQRIAVLLCKFKGSEETEPDPREFFEDLFNHRGTGGLNDYWIDVSHGKINLDGTEIFGWNVLEQNQSEYIASHASRWDKIKGAMDAFPNIDFAKYAGIVAIFNMNVGDGGKSNNGVLASSENYSSTFIAHELGHIFELDHSFDQSDRKRIEWSAPGEYWDKYDIMSAMNVFSHIHSRFGASGPILCSANMEQKGWLDPARVWKPPHNGSGVYTFDIVSLGHPEIPGYLTAKIGDYLYIEFRTKDGWDKEIPQDAVLIHELSNTNAVLITTKVVAFEKNKIIWDHDWLPGEVYGPDTLEMEIKGGTQIVIDSFNSPEKKARITIRRRAARPAIQGQIFGGVAKGGEGFIILPSGKIKKIPPHSPILEMVSQLSDIEGMADQRISQEFSKEILFKAMEIIFRNI